METSSRRIAINMAGGYVPGLNSVITGAVLAASELGWEAVGIHDGFDGILFPERYSEGGVIPPSPSAVRELYWLGVDPGQLTKCRPVSGALGEYREPGRRSRQVRRTTARIAARGLTSFRSSAHAR
jgi:hypothetical protein